MYGSKVDFPDLKQMTNFNPVLLHTAIQVQKAQWIDKYNDVFKAHLWSSIMRKIETLIVSTFHTAEGMPDINCYVKQLCWTDFF